MNTAEKQFSKILTYLADDLDVPKDVYEDAVSKYEDLAAWVKADCEEQFEADGEIYHQGSIRLGTLIRPVKEEDDIDVDLVLRRDIKRASTTQDRLKQETGEQLKRYIQHLKATGSEAPKLDEGKRCWTLEYSGGFHMDVLPALPDEESWKHNVRDLLDGIVITDTELRNWRPSNPKGYANWFNRQNALMLSERRVEMAKAASVDVESIPEQTVPTPLRRAVQLLKRHRDLRYEGNSDDKPISIIITTLAAKSYREEEDAYSAVIGIAERMASHIENRDGVYWVENPVNNSENFADKWEEHPERRDEFVNWLSQVKADIARAARQKGMHNVTVVLAEAFGESAAKSAIDRMGEDLYEKRDAGTLKMVTGSGILGAAGVTQVPPHTFFGHDNED